MRNKDMKTTVLSSLIWRFAERCGAQGISFIVTIVLARLMGRLQLLMFLLIFFLCL